MSQPTRNDIEKRPQFARLLGRVKQVRPYVVIVYSMDRWARSLVVSSTSIQRLREWGVKFASVTEQMFDFTSPSSDLQMNILAAFSQFLSAMTAQHVRRVNDLKLKGECTAALSPSVTSPTQKTRGQIHGHRCHMKRSFRSLRNSFVECCPVMRHTGRLRTG